MAPRREHASLQGASPVAYGNPPSAAPPRRAGLRSWLAVWCTRTAALYLTSPPLLRRLRRILPSRSPLRGTPRSAPPASCSPVRASSQRHRDTNDTSHRGIFAAYGTAGKSHFEEQALSGDIPGSYPGGRQGVSCQWREGVSPAHNPQASITKLAVKITPGCVSATRGDFSTRFAIGYAMASMIALKVPLGRIAFDVLTGSGS